MKQLLRHGEAAKYLGLTWWQFKEHVIKRDAIPCKRLGTRGHRFYWITDLNRWRDNSATVPTMPVVEKPKVKKSRGRIPRPDTRYQIVPGEHKQRKRNEMSNETAIEVLQAIANGEVNPNVCDRLFVPNWFNREHLTEFAGREVTPEEMEDFKRWANDDMADQVSELVMGWLASYLKNERDKRLGKEKKG